MEKSSQQGSISVMSSEDCVRALRTLGSHRMRDWEGPFAPRPPLPGPYVPRPSIQGPPAPGLFMLGPSASESAPGPATPGPFVQVLSFQGVSILGLSVLGPSSRYALYLTRMPNGTNDGEIYATDSTTGMCTLTIRRHCLSASCQHIQCFDGLTFIRRCDTNEFWVCPVCGHRVPFFDIKVHRQWVNVLQNVREAFRELEFNKIGKLNSVITDIKTLFVFKEELNGSDIVPVIVAMECACCGPRNANSSSSSSSPSGSMDTFDADATALSTSAVESFLRDIDPSNVSSSIPEDFDVDLYEFANRGTNSGDVSSDSSDTESEPELAWVLKGLRK